MRESERGRSSDPADPAGAEGDREPLVAPEVDEEIAFHLAMREEQNRARGLSAAAARREALERFGDVHRIREACVREKHLNERSGGWRGLLWGLGGDVRLALRQLRRSPGYAAVAVLTLSLGIGANTVIFGFANPYFLRPLPFADADQLVHLYQTDPLNGWDRGRFSLPQVRELREGSRGFTDLAAYNYGVVNITGEGSAERRTVGRLTANAFDVLGAQPLMGRTFAAGEDGPDGGAPVVVLGWGVWQARYAGDPAIIGKAIELDGVSRTVIGVMPRDFNFPFGGVTLWIPLADVSRAADREAANFLLFGRLAPGWTTERAVAELRTLHEAMRLEHPDADGRMGTVISVPLREALNFAWDILRIAAAAMFAAVGVLLLIACANIAGLSLARSEARRREVAVRAALGASRYRILRQSILEMLLLSVVAGLLGAVGAGVALRLLADVIPEDVYRVGDFGLDGNALVFSAAVIITAALLAGMAPALLASRMGAGSALREEEWSAGGRRAGRLRGALVAGEVALGLVLTVAAGLTARSLARASELALGFDAGGVMTAEVSLPAYAYPDAAAVNGFYERVLERLRASPGVEAAGTHGSLPLNHETYTFRVEVEGRPLPEEQRPIAQSFGASDGYFEAMGITLLEGRLFTHADGRDAPRVVVVNRTFARTVLDGDAPGRRIILDDAARTPATVIGVVEDVQHADLSENVPPQLYASLSQRPFRRQFIVVRAARPEVAPGLLREALAEVDPDVPATIRPMQSFVDEHLLRWSILATTLAVFGAIGLGLGAIGLYGLVAFSVQRRRREIGVHLALGARPRTVAVDVVRDGVRLAVVGIGLGLLGALAAGKLLSAALFGVEPADPLTFAVASAVYVGVAFAASAVPAWRATRADPLTALRAD